MPVWAQDILAAFILLGGGAGYWFVLFYFTDKCPVPGCWKAYGNHLVDGQLVCDRHARDTSWRDQRPS